MSKINEKLMLVSNVAAVGGWVGLFLYSAYVLVSRYYMSQGLTILHYIFPVVFALVSVRAIRRLLLMRRAQQRA